MMQRKRTDYIVIHCADTPANMDIGAAEIRKWHVEDNGWNDIGYHFVIRRDGRREKGRDLAITGSHVKGFNSCSIGICLVGGMGGNNFTAPQFKELGKLVSEMKNKYPKAEVVGHCDLNLGKTCPSFNVIKWYNDLTKGK